MLAIGATAGQATEPAGGVIKIGMVNDQTGPNQGAGRSMKVGVDAYFKAVNEKGGVNGKKIELVSVNDMYVPDKTVDGLLKLVEEQKIFAVIGTIGTSNGVSIMHIVKEHKLPFVAPRSGASNFRIPVTHEIINIRASHQEEVDKLVDLLVREGGAKRFAIFYQNDTFGLDVFTCTENALKRHGLTLVSKGSFERGTQAVTSALATIMEGKPRADRHNRRDQRQHPHHQPGGPVRQQARRNRHPRLSSSPASPMSSRSWLGNSRWNSHQKGGRQPLSSVLSPAMQKAASR